MNTIGIIGLIIGLMATIELGMYLPFSAQLETRNDRRIRRIYFFIVLVATIAATTTTESLLNPMLNAPYSVYLVVTLVVFYFIYRLSKRI